MIIITDLLIIDHLISVSVTLLYLALVFRHLNNFSILNLKFEQVQFATHFSVLNSWMSGKQCRPWWDAAYAASHLGLHCLLMLVWPNAYSKIGHMVRVMLNQIGKIITISSVITNRLSVTMAALIIDYFYAPRRISGEHIVAASSVRPCVRTSVCPCVRASVPLLSTQILGNCLSDFNETSWEY